jgi:hypothetical protein
MGPTANLSSASRSRVVGWYCVDVRGHRQKRQGTLVLSLSHSTQQTSISFIMIEKAAFGRAALLRKGFNLERRYCPTADFSPEKLKILLDPR